MVLSEPSSVLVFPTISSEDNFHGLFSDAGAPPTSVFLVALVNDVSYEV